MAQVNNFPKLHNAMWPGLVGKGPDSEPPIDLDTMIDLTARARVDGIRFDGIDIFLAEPHTSIDASDDDLKKLADKVGSQGLVIGSMVAPVWPPVGGGSAMGSADERRQFVTMVKKVMSSSPKNSVISAFEAMASCASFRRQASTPGRRPDGQYQADRADFPRGLRRGRKLWRAPGCRGRDLLGRYARLEEHGRAPQDGRPAEDARFAGRYGAHAAVCLGLQRAGTAHGVMVYVWNERLFQIYSENFVAIPIALFLVPKSIFWGRGVAIQNQMSLVINSI